VFFLGKSHSAQLFSRTKLVVASKRGDVGFQVLNLTTNNSQSLPPLDFARQKKIKPMTIFRLSETFLVCYDSAYCGYTVVD
jgi:hypothetical protein